MASSTSELRPSPAARAFFSALDKKDEEKDTKQSSFVKKRIQTLGWRNRYSQAEFYPVSLHVPLSLSSPSSKPCEFSVLQVQRGELEGTYGTGATVWPASMVLLKYLEKHAETLLKKKRVVDLGSGTGVTSIGAAVLGASHVICTDGEPKVVQLALDNMERVARQFSCSSGTPKEEPASIGSSSFLMPGGTVVSVQEYWWGAGAAPGGESPCDVVLVSDCVLPKLYPIAPLVEALDQLLRKPAAVAILSYEHRYYEEYDPKDKFRELLAAKGLTMQVIPLEQQDSVYSTDDIEIWHVVRVIS